MKFGDRISAEATAVLRTLESSIRVENLYLS